MTDRPGRRGHPFSRWCEICKGQRRLVGNGAKRSDKILMCRVCDVREPDRATLDSRDEQPGKA